MGRFNPAGQIETLLRPPDPRRMTWPSLLWGHFNIHVVQLWRLVLNGGDGRSKD